MSRVLTCRRRRRTMTLALIALFFGGCKPEEKPPGAPTAVKPAQASAAGRAIPALPSPAILAEGSAPVSPSRPAPETPLPASTSPASLSSRPADPVPPFLPLTQARKGEWVEYAALDERTLRYEVEQATAASVTTRVTVMDHGKPLGEPALREDVRELDPLARDAAVSRASRTVVRERIKAGGRQWDALRYEDRWTDEEVSYVRRTWVSFEVPAFGIIRMELSGDEHAEARLELIRCSPR